MQGLSIIVPALNEAALIGDAVRRLRALVGVDEVIVVDGGSDDDTANLATEAGARVVTSERGRGLQQNAGARVATGNVLWFVHADVVPPRNGASEIERILAVDGVVAGAFCLRHVPMRWKRSWKRRLLRIADVRSRVTGVPYGDQCMFMSRATFDAVGGFPQTQLMEDLELSKRLRSFGRIEVSRSVALASGRRLEQGSVYQCLMMNTFPTLHALGVSTDTLAKLYGSPR